MELLLLLIYTFFVWLIFFKFKWLPWNIVSQVIVVTVPGKGWNTLLRLYGPLEPWFEKTWRPGEIEEVR